MSLQWAYMFHHLWKKKGTLANGFLWSLGFWAFLSRKFFIRCSCSGEFTRNSKVFSTDCNSPTCLWVLECSKHIYVWIFQTKPFPKNKGWTVHTVLWTSCPYWLQICFQVLTQYHGWRCLQRIASLRTEEIKPSHTGVNTLPWERGNNSVSRNPQAQLSYLHCSLCYQDWNGPEALLA